jgi:hypothetical protein
MSPENSTTQVAGSPFAAPEFLPGLYRANPAQTDVFGDGLYRLEFIKGGASLSPPVYDTYQLRGGQEAALAPVTTDAASRAASQNDLSLIATTAQVNAARDAVIAAPAFTTGDRATLNAISTRASEVRLANLETVARDSTAATYRGLTTEQNTQLLSIPTNPLLASNYVAPNNAGIASLGTAVAAIPTTPLLASAYVAPDNATIIAAAQSAATIESRLTSDRAAKLDTVALTSNLTTTQNAIINQGNDAWTTATAAGLGLPAITTALTAIPTQTLASGDPALIATAVKAALDAQLNKIIDLEEADVVKTLTTYVKNRRGTQTAMFPSKTVAATGDNVSIRQL